MGKRTIKEEDFDITASEVARGSGTIVETVRDYADKNLIQCKRLGNGTRLFRRSVIDQVKAIREQRLANRGRKALPA